MGSYLCIESACRINLAIRMVFVLYRALEFHMDNHVSNLLYQDKGVTWFEHTTCSQFPPPARGHVVQACILFATFKCEIAPSSSSSLKSGRRRLLIGEEVYLQAGMQVDVEA